MAERNVSVEVHVHVVDNKQLEVEHQTSPGDTDNSNSIQLATTSMSVDDDCGYRRMISDVLSSGETVTTVNESESDVTDGYTHSQCNIQQQQHQDSSNSATRADDHMFVTMSDGNDVSTQSLIQYNVS